MRQGSSAPDVTVVGSGPNGLAAALTVAQAGFSVRVIEAEDIAGGGMRTASLIEPGFVHDVCSAIHPMAFASPFFRALGLREKLAFEVPEVSYAHVVGEGDVGLAYHSLERAVEGLGRDGRAWARMFSGLVRNVDEVAALTLSNPAGGVPSGAQVEFAVRAARFAAQGASAFSDSVAPALLAGTMAHAIGEGRSLASSLVGTALATHAHAGGWPIVVGGSARIADVLLTELALLGATVETGRRIRRIEEVSDSSAVLLDVTPRQLSLMVDGHAPSGWQRAMDRFEYGPGVAKIDATLDGPIPWRNAELSQAGTVHLAGTAQEVWQAERDVRRGRFPDEPFVLLSQPSAFDGSRAPAGKHVLWAYTHVPSGSRRDMTEPILRRIEQEAPGFRDLVRHVRHAGPVEMERHNANYVGGDISAGATTLGQIVARPRLSRDPWSTPVDGVYLCSASTSPGPGVHGMSGWYAARSALRAVFGVKLAALPWRS